MTVLQVAQLAQLDAQLRVQQKGVGVRRAGLGLERLGGLHGLDAKLDGRRVAALLVRLVGRTREIIIIIILYIIIIIMYVVCLLSFIMNNNNYYNNKQTTTNRTINI